MFNKTRHDPFIDTVFEGKYYIERKLGTGGHASVYLGRHMVISRLVAIKILDPTRVHETHHYDWFVREARAVNRARHRNIINIHDVQMSAGRLPYLIMEYFEGETLEQILKTDILCDTVFSMRIIREVAYALDHAHRCGIVHRDIKASNILINQQPSIDPCDIVRLIDFGLCSMRGERQLANSDAVFGTLEYMSPEQTRGSILSPTSDMYSLGVVFYEMVTGQIPFISHNRKRSRLLEMHQKKIPTPPINMNQDVPCEISDLIMRMLEKKAEDRPASMRQLIQELDVIKLAIQSPTR